MVGRLFPAPVTVKVPEIIFIFWVVKILTTAGGEVTSAWWRFGLNSITAFWMAYVVTRPLGASFADYISKPSSLTGIGFGNGPTALVFALTTFVLLSYLATVQPDIQRPVRTTDGRLESGTEHAHV